MRSTLGLIALLAALLAGGPVTCLAQSEAAVPRSAGVYFAAYRTPRHMKYSKPEVFHQAVAEVAAYLQANRVQVVEDPVRKRIESSDVIPVATLVGIARDAGASSILVLSVDRPVTKWVKIELESYDLSGNLLWKESAAEGGGLSGKGGVEKALGKLRKRLEPRLGHPGLEQAPASEQRLVPAHAAPSKS